MILRGARSIDIDLGMVQAAEVAEFVGEGLVELAVAQLAVGLVAIDPNAVQRHQGRGEVAVAIEVAGAGNADDTGIKPERGEQASGSVEDDGALRSVLARVSDGVELARRIHRTGGISSGGENRPGVLIRDFRGGNVL